MLDRIRKRVSEIRQCHTEHESAWRDWREPDEGGMSRYQRGCEIRITQEEWDAKTPKQHIDRVVEHVEELPVIGGAA